MNNLEEVDNFNLIEKNVNGYEFQCIEKYLSINGSTSQPGIVYFEFYINDLLKNSEKIEMNLESTMPTKDANQIDYNYNFSFFSNNETKYGYLSSNNSDWANYTKNGFYYTFEGKTTEMINLIHNHINVNNIDTNNLSCKIYRVYKIYDDNSMDVMNQYVYRYNQYSGSTAFFRNINHLMRFFSISEEVTYNHSLNCLIAEKHFILSEPPLNVGEYYVDESIGEVDDSDLFVHYVNFQAEAGESYLPAECMMTLNTFLKINNVSIKDGQNNIIQISPQIMIATEIPTEIDYDTFNLRVDLPNSPYFSSDYVSSNIEPSRIIQRGTGQSLIWDYCPKFDIIITYQIVENPIPKKIDSLIEETNLISKQSQESSDTALWLGKLSFCIAVFSLILSIRNINYGKIKNKLDNIKTYITTQTHKKILK